MPGTSPSDERTCDTTTLLRHYLYLSTCFLTVRALSSSLLLSFSIFPSLPSLIPRPSSTSFARFHFVPPSPRPRLLELSTRATDFSRSCPLYQRHLQRTFSLRFDFQRNLQKFTENRDTSKYMYICKNQIFFQTFETQIFSILFLNIKNCKLCSLMIVNCL